jgi:hypothetical protein
MAKTKVNVINEHPDKTGERRCGVLDIDTQIVKISNRVEKPLAYYEDKDPNGVGFFETRSKGKIIQKTGRYENP